MTENTFKITELIALTDMTELVTQACAALKNSYSPYSGFAVGAALQCTDGSIYRGCNIENAAYPATICAERAAFSAAVSDGKRSFDAIAIAGGRNGEISSFCPPCGICRQFISELCDNEFRIILYDGKMVKEYSMAELLPAGFGRDSL